ncbi:MAG: Smr/MutS family protein [Burkholderiaceae bacterium]|nr:Smr/MutS family protein [Burkholderiaceae bacterium]
MSRPDKHGPLSDEELKLLTQAYRQVIPLKGHARVTHQSQSSPWRPSQQAMERRARAVAEPGANAKLSDGDPYTLDDAPETYRAAGVSGEALRRLRREADKVRECLDLHGLTRDQARVTLQHFVRAATSRGVTRVRVIHGQGYGSQGGTSVLRYLARHWLAQMPEVLGFVTPAPAQGGKGAVLALLRASQSRHEGLR